MVGTGIWLAAAELAAEPDGLVREPERNNNTIPGELSLSPIAKRKNNNTIPRALIVPVCGEKE